MSRVVIQPLNILGGGGLADATLFEDTLAPPDQPFLIGDQWQFVWEPNDATGVSGQQMAASFNRVVGPPAGLQITNPTGGNTIPRGFCLPRPLSWNRVQGRAQFAEMVIGADNSVGGSVTRNGPMVMCNPNLGTCYYAILVVETGPFQINLSRFAANADTNLAIATPNAFALGDEITITADPVVGQVDLTVKVNGVNVLTFSDNAGAQLRTGMPGYHVSGSSSTRAQTISNFRAGILSRL